jgi:hypothetical protein
MRRRICVLFRYYLDLSVVVAYEEEDLCHMRRRIWRVVVCMHTYYIRYYLDLRVAVCMHVNG